MVSGTRMAEKEMRMYMEHEELHRKFKEEEAEEEQRQIELQRMGEEDEQSNAKRRAEQEEQDQIRRKGVQEQSFADIISDAIAQKKRKLEEAREREEEERVVRVRQKIIARRGFRFIP